MENQSWILFVTSNWTQNHLDDKTALKAMDNYMKL